MSSKFELFGREPTESIWRYTSLAKLLNMIEGPNEMNLIALQTKEFEDDYEGTLSRNALLELEKMIVDDSQNKYLFDFGPVRHKYTENVRNDIRRDYYRGARSKVWSAYDMIERMREITFANCWNIGNVEDSNMWGSYTTKTDGVVIKSNFESFKDSIISSEGKLYVGDVEYIDFEEGGEKMRNKAIAPFFYKKKEFRNESEFRFVVTDYSREKLNIENSITSMPDTEDRVRKIKLDTTTFIDEIRVHSQSDDYLKRVLTDLLQDKDVDIPVNDSSLKPNLS
ncbi:hypothetical protein [Halohasta litorea]|uniref:DUF2971 domain-containing protein n=1 Tax=Halohasta litorea TaxID=869891 RepID=A0ABD6D514_9EURY|nr:hypothetical protein [Halohasta litorea]